MNEHSTNHPIIRRSSISILIVEDNHVDHILLERMLGRIDLEITVDKAFSLKEASDYLKFREYTCALVDLGLPDGNGMKLLDVDSPTPVIIMTHYENEEFATTAMRSGAQDYLVKGEFDHRQLLRAIRYAVERNRLMSELALSHSELEATNDRLEALVINDPLTGLYNRRGLEHRLSTLIKEAGRQRKFAFMMVDLDHFKSINDTYGHTVGDQVLQNVSRWLEKNAREVDCIARYGGEEFAILMVDVDEVLAASIATRFCEEMPKTLTHPRPITASFGICGFDHGSMDKDSLISNADAALYRAKAAGRSCVRTHKPALPRMKIIS